MASRAAPHRTATPAGRKHDNTAQHPLPHRGMQLQRVVHQFLLRPRLPPLVQPLPQRRLVARISLCGSAGCSLLRQLLQCPASSSRMGLVTSREAAAPMQSPVPCPARSTHAAQTLHTCPSTHTNIHNQTVHPPAPARGLQTPPAAPQRAPSAPPPASPSAQPTCPPPAHSPCARPRSRPAWSRRPPRQTCRWTVEGGRGRGGGISM